MAYALSGPNRPLRDHKICTICITSFDVHLRYASEMNSQIESREAYWNEWHNVVQDYIKKGFTIHFSWTTKSDQVETMAFLDSNPLMKDYFLFNNSLCLSNLLDNFAGSDVVVAGRMHGLILAIICGCEVKPWMISKKIENFSNDYLSLHSKTLYGEIEVVIDSILS
mgnify:CR=1 FL=1